MKKTLGILIDGIFYIFSRSLVFGTIFVRLCSNSEENYVDFVKKIIAKAIVMGSSKILINVKWNQTTTCSIFLCSIAVSVHEELSIEDKLTASTVCRRDWKVFFLFQSMSVPSTEKTNSDTP